MAEAIAKSLLKEDYEVYSAGIEPTVVNPYAIKVMEELGIDISDYKSKHLNTFEDMFFEYVITVCDIYSDSFRPKKAHTKRAFQKYQSIRTNQSGREITKKLLKILLSNIF